jgi:hypothetical protein
LHRGSTELVTPNCRLRSTTPSSDSPRQTRSCITICGLHHPTLSTRCGQTLEGNPRRHAVCGPAAIKSALLFPPRPPRAAAPLPPHLLDWRRLSLVASHLHTVSISARWRLAPLTLRPTARPSRSPASRVSAFRRAPELCSRYGHRVPASRATAFHRTPPARAVARHVVALHSYSFFFFGCRIRAYSGLATSLPRTPESRACRSCSSAQEVAGE